VISARGEESEEKVAPVANGFPRNDEGMRRRSFHGDRLLTVADVAETMRVSNMTVYRLIKNGSLAAVRVGKNYRIRESEVDRYLSEQSVQFDSPE
jgi:excisionase family DNA binding protein